MTLSPHTAAELLAELERNQLTPAVDGHTLVLPPHLSDMHHRSLQVLHTGVRAILSNRPWYGCSCATGWSMPLSPERPIPGWVGLLCVAGDTIWYRIPALKLNEWEHFFTNTPEPKPAERRKALAAATPGQTAIRARAVRTFHSAA
jgi:hypothetical protein